MAKRGRRPNSGGRKAGQDRHRAQARPTKGRPVPARGRRVPDLLTDAGRLLAGGEPVDFLGYVSCLLAAVDPRWQNPFERADRPQPVTLPQLLESFADVVLPETTALLAAIAELGPDELTRARARRALPARPHPLPDWLAGLGGTSVYRAVESSHVLGDGDSVLLAARMPGRELTAVIYIDHNLGTVVKDAFPAPSPVSDVAGRMREAMDDPDVRFADIGLADARARVAQAIELGAMTFPPFETETWPASRPLTEWLLRLLPEGGTGYSGRYGARPRRRSWRTGSSARSSAGRSTMVTAGTCWISSCGSAPITGRATRCGGARSRWRSCWPTGSRARSSPARGT